MKTIVDRELKDVLEGVAGNPVREDRALNPALSKMNIVCFYHPRHKWRGFLTG